jgi:hypothetical protein
MSYERTDLTTNNCIRESFEEVVMILLLIVCTFCFFLIQLFTKRVVCLPFYNNYSHHLVNIKCMVEDPLTKNKIGIHPTKVISFGSFLPM